MNREIYLGRGASLAKAVARLATIVTLAGALASAAWAEEGSATTILKAMAEYVSRQEHLTLKYDTDIEVVTRAVEKVQFCASGDVAKSRPNRFRISRTGGYADVELVSDGSTVTVHDSGGKWFAQVPEGGSFDEVVDTLRSEASLELLGADLLLSKPYEELMAGVLEAKHIGRGVIGGCRVRASWLPQPRDRLADPDLSRREAGAAQVRHHKQGGWSRTPTQVLMSGIISEWLNLNGQLARPSTAALNNEWRVRLVKRRDQSRQRRSLLIFYS
jgi:outer membrane lipoprotein-sorting protein